MDLAAYVQHLMTTHPGSSRVRHLSLSTSRQPSVQHTPTHLPGNPPSDTAALSRNHTHSQRHLTHPYQRSRRHSQPIPPSIVNPPNIQPLPATVQHAIKLAWAPATQARYDVSIKEFLTFCASEKVPEAETLPASEMLLALFAASLVGRIAGTTISAKLSAVKAWHIQHNQPWRGNILLQYVLKGAANATPDTSKQDRRPPITIDMLKELFRDLDLADHLDTAIFVVATMAFYGQLRLGEICSDREVYNTFNCKTLPNFSHLKPPHTVAGSRMLHIPWTKVKRATGEDVAICRQRDITDPIAALHRHLQINVINDPTTAIASYLTTAGTRKLLTTSKFMKRCNQIWRTHDRQRHTGHCFRIGGTTHYLLQGINPDVVRLMGRWSSDAFIRYWRQLDVVATVHTENLHVMHRNTRRRSSAS
jgi:hypothetical protein